MVGPDEEERLFSEIVQARIRQSPSGLVEYPLDAMREYCAAVGDDSRRFGFFLASQADDYGDDFQFCIGLDCDTEARISVDRVYYYDEQQNLLETMKCGNVLLDELMSCFCKKNVVVANEAVMDKDGYLYLRARCTVDIVADFRISLSKGSFGFSLYELNGEMTYRFWRDENTFFCAPTKVFFIRCNDLS